MTCVYQVLRFMQFYNKDGDNIYYTVVIKFGYSRGPPDVTVHHFSTAKSKWYACMKITIGCNTDLRKCLYSSSSTVQLSSKVTFARVSDAFHTRSGRAHRLAKKGRGTRVRLVAALLQGFALAWTRLTCVPDASCTRFRRVRTLPWS